MKKILITGANSYIGTSFEKWVTQWPDKYTVDTVDMVDGSWKKKDFSRYDVVFHVAGIAHIKETKKNALLYYKVNRDLALETATKAKAEGVKQFIFLSSMSVYGIETGVITMDTAPNPKSNYGKSKLQAEEQITTLSDEKFHIAIIRPPMVYGKECKGNYQTLSKFAKMFSIFPDYKNQRSMIFISNLCAFTQKIIDNCKAGLFCPQNREYICTSEMIRLVAEMNGKKVRLTKVLNCVILFLIKLRIGIAIKIFGDLIYEVSSFSDWESTVVCDFFQSIRLSEDTKQIIGIKE